MAYVNGTYQNDYKELPVLSYDKTAIPLVDLREYIDNTSYSIAQKTATISLIRKETSCTNGINNNFAGVQADSGRWDKKWEKHFVGVVHKVDGAGKYRWFLAFDSWQSCVDFMLERVKKRGIYVGGYALVYAKTWITTIDAFITSYYKEWVQGSHLLLSPIPSDEYRDLLSIYNQEYKYFSQSIQKKNLELQERLRAIASNSSYNIRFFLFGK